MTDPLLKPRMEPPASEASAPFWDATRERKLLLQWCRACDQVVHYPRVACPECLGTEFDWRPASGKGEVYAVSVIHRPPMPAWSKPYPVVLVTLSEGARMMSNVVGCAPEDVKVGMRVEVCWEPLSDGRHLPQFQPAP